MSEVSSSRSVPADSPSDSSGFSIARLDPMPTPNQVVAVIAGGAEGKEVTVVTGDRLLSADCKASKIPDVVDAAMAAGQSGSDPAAAWEAMKQATKLKSLSIQQITSIEWRSDDLDEFKLHYRDGDRAKKRTMLASDTNDAVLPFIASVAALRTNNQIESAKHSVRDLTAMEASLGPGLASLAVAVVGGFGIMLSMANPAEIEEAGSGGRRQRRGKAIAQIANSIGPFWVSTIVALILAGCLIYWYLKLSKRPQRHAVEF